MEDNGQISTGKKLIFWLVIAVLLVYVFASNDSDGLLLLIGAVLLIPVTAIILLIVALVQKTRRTGLYVTAYILAAIPLAGGLFLVMEASGYGSMGELGEIALWLIIGSLLYIFTMYNIGASKKPLPVENTNDGDTETETEMEAPAVTAKDAGHIAVQVLLAVMVLWGLPDLVSLFTRSFTPLYYLAGTQILILAFQLYVLFLWNKWKTAGWKLLLFYCSWSILSLVMMLQFVLSSGGYRPASMLRFQQFVPALVSVAMLVMAMRPAIAERFGVAAKDRVMQLVIMAAAALVASFGLTMLARLAL